MHTQTERQRKDGGPVSAELRRQCHKPVLERQQLLGDLTRLERELAFDVLYTGSSEEVQSCN